MSEAQINIEVDNENKMATVVLSGVLTILTIDTFMPELNSVTDKFSKIRIEGRDITEMDLPALQLIVSLSKTFNESGKQMNFDFELTDIVKKTIDNSGLYEFLIK